MVLQDHEKELREQLKEKQKQLHAVRPTTAQTNKDKSEIKRLENCCQTSLQKYNDL